MAENHIKAVLADKRKPFTCLAQEIGVSETTISRWTSTRMQPSITQFGKVASALEVDIRKLLRPTK